MKNFKLLCSAIALAITLQTTATVTKTINGVEIRIEKGDITQCKVDAIVNAANPQLQAGGGVCGAIFAAAGVEQLQHACNQFPTSAELWADKRVLEKIVDEMIDYDTTQDPQSQVRCPVGQACITPSFQLQKKGIMHIIHAVGPDCRIVKDPQEQDALLRSAYQNSLRVAEENGVISLAFPFISSAIYAFPKARAARIALEELIGYATGGCGMRKSTGPKIGTITLVLHSQEDYALLANMCKATYFMTYCPQHRRHH